jgi:hypothetical protein
VEEEEEVGEVEEVEEVEVVEVERWGKTSLALTPPLPTVLVVDFPAIRQS